SRARCAAPPLHPCAPAVPTASSGKAILSCDTSTHTPPPARPARPMPSRAGSADLPLHGGRVPAWLGQRMTRLGAVISQAIVHHYGPAQLLRRLAHPFCFHSFRAVVGTV